LLVSAVTVPADVEERPDALVVIIGLHFNNPISRAFFAFSWIQV
jgi:hypothetical protein